MSFETGDDINFELPSHWKWCQLDELKADEKGSIISGPFGSNISSKYFVNEGVPVIRGNNLSLSFERFIDDGFVFVSEEKAKELNTWARHEDIILTAAGTIGQVGIIGKETNYSNYIISNKQIRVRLNTEKILPLFAYYWLASPLMIEYIQQRNTGSTIPLINLSIVRTLPIPLPPLREQEIIVSILSALDDKIELNRQTNATLEAIAQAIFKEWFVDFNFPGATGEMEESALGLIPKGWRVGRLGDVCKNIRKTVHPRDVHPDTAYVGLEHIPRKSLGLLSWGVSQDVDSQKAAFKKNHILFGKLRPYFHKVCIAPFDGICSTDILVIEPVQREFFSFCLNHLFSDEVIAYVSAIADGTRMPRVNWESIQDYEVVIPPDHVLGQFNDVIIPLYELILMGNQQSITLVSLRDTLLPMLMQGELEV